ncbi:MAG: heme-binding domain-containing protein [Bacteroidetes bacterium]|nr:heme-binding domain-containing protein [Bacteroidota bacterium]
MKQSTKIILGIVSVVILIQFYRPARNESNDQSHHISTIYPVPDQVSQILRPACYDCHSNYTIYPWYANVQPVASWLTHHVNEGKEELNFSEFATYSPRRQYHKLEEVIKMIDDKKMPLESYTLIHKDAILTADQRTILTQWAQGIMDTMKATYPADSLKRPQRKPDAGA